jgi:RHS repeat-associated protein
MIVATRRGTVKIWVTHQSGRDFLAHTFVDVEFETASSPADLPSDPAGIGFWGPSFMNQQPMHTLTPEMWVTGAILAAYRRLPDFVLAQRKARWADTDAAATRALSGAHVLVVGAASIGAAVPTGSNRSVSTCPRSPGGPGGRRACTHIGAREYDPFIGRFISVDPVMDLSDPQQMHGYPYANNSPATYSDPQGSGKVAICPS